MFVLTWVFAFAVIDTISGACGDLKNSAICEREISCQWSSSSGCVLDSSCFSGTNDAAGTCSSSTCNAGCNGCAKINNYLLCYNTSYHGSSETGGRDSCSYRDKTTAGGCPAGCEQYGSYCLESGLSNEEEEQTDPCLVLGSTYCHYVPYCYLLGGQCVLDTCFEFNDSDLACTSPCVPYSVSYDTDEKIMYYCGRSGKTVDLCNIMSEFVDANDYSSSDCLGDAGCAKEGTITVGSEQLKVCVNGSAACAATSCAQCLSQGYCTTAGCTWSGNTCSTPGGGATCSRSSCVSCTTAAACNQQPGCAYSGTGCVNSHIADASDQTAWYSLMFSQNVPCSALEGAYIEYCDHVPSCKKSGAACVSDACIWDTWASNPDTCTASCTRASYQGTAGCIEAARTYDQCFDLRPQENRNLLQCAGSGCYNHTIETELGTLVACLNYAPAGTEDPGSAASVLHRPFSFSVSFSVLGSVLTLALLLLLSLD